MKLRTLLFSVLMLTSFLGFSQFTPFDESGLELIYVSKTGSDANPGTEAAPFLTIKKALGTASSKIKTGVGCKVLVGPGVYREGTAGGSWIIQLWLNGSDVKAPFVLEGQGWKSTNPTNTGDVIITGADDFSGGWTKNVDGTWSKDWPYKLGMGTNTSNNGVSDAFLHYETLRVNGQNYYQLNPPAPYDNQNSDANGKFGGYSEGDYTSTDNPNGGRLTADEGSFWVQDAVLSGTTVMTMGKVTIKLPANTPGVDINAALVEITTKQRGFQIAGNGSVNSPNPNATNFVLRNLVFQQLGYWPCLIQGHNNFLIEDCKFNGNKHQGVNITACTNFTIRRSDFSENGETGMGFGDTPNSLLEYCKFNRNSRQGEIVGYTGWSVSGVKFLSFKGINNKIKIYRCEALDNRSTGFWWDTGNSECEMVECVSMRNSGRGTFIEANTSTENNYASMGGGTKGTEGIANLGSKPTVTARYCIFANNKPAPGTESYRSGKSTGVFFSENENAVIENCLIYGNPVQIGVYDNSRGECRNFTIRNNVIAANSDARIYANGSVYDSNPTISPKNSSGTVVATFKGAWYAFYDGLSGTTNDNLYYYPNSTAFPDRTQRWSTARWSNSASPYFNVLPTQTLEQWRISHLNNANNGFADKSVDSRSVLKVGAYDENLPLVSITADVNSLTEDMPKTRAFTVRRLSAKGYDQPLTVNYSVRNLAGDATNRFDFQSLSGSVVIPAGEHSVGIEVTPIKDQDADPNEKIALALDSNNSGFVVASSLATVVLDGTTANVQYPRNGTKTVKVWPNPLSGSVLNVEFAGFRHQEYVKIKISEFSGRVVSQEVVSTTAGNIAKQIFLPNQLAKGFYFLNVESEDGSRMAEKLIVQ